MFEELQKIGPAYGSFPEPIKSILVVQPEMVDTPVPKQHPTQTNNPNTTINPPVDYPSNDGDRGDILFRGLWKI
jgi:hypothetical protein